MYCMDARKFLEGLNTLDKYSKNHSETTFSHIAFAISHRQSYIAYIPDRKSGKTKKKERKKT